MHPPPLLFLISSQDRNVDSLVFVFFPDCWGYLVGIPCLGIWLCFDYLDFRGALFFLFLIADFL
jgi:hypothetical protein